MSNKLHLKIVTPQGTYRDVEADIVNVRSTNGMLGILPRHIPLATGVEISELNYKNDGESYDFAVSGGFMYVGDNSDVTVIVNSCESPEEIDLRRAEEAKARAEGRLKNPSQDIDLKRAEVALKRAINRIHVKG